MECIIHEYDLITGIKKGFFKMTKHELVTIQENSVIRINPDTNTDNIAVLDISAGTITINKTLIDTLNQLPDIIKKGNKLIKETDINDLDEDELTALNKQIQPIKKYESNIKKVRKAFADELKSYSTNILDQFDTMLSNTGFDQLPDITKNLRQLQNDYKENRANKRWDKLNVLFNAQLELYPEFKKYAPNTLGSFNHYRIHHPKLVSKNKNKKVNDETIKTLNDDLYQYHEDLQRLLNSKLASTYYTRIIDQYVEEPTTSNMLNLIEQGLKQQTVDEQEKLLATVRPTAKTLIDTLWYDNKALNEKLDELNTQNDPQFMIKKLKLMRVEADMIIDTLDPKAFLNGLEIDTTQLKESLKTELPKPFNRVYTKLKDHYSKPKPEPKEQKPEPVKEEPYKWLLDHLQNIGLTNIHNNDAIKIQVLRMLYTDIGNPTSIWRQNVHSNKDIIELNQYILNM